MNFNNVRIIARRTFTSNSSSVADLKNRSSRATCGAFEREITVRAEEVTNTKARLRNAGFMIVGTSEPIGRTRKIWFVARGAAGL